MHQPNNYLIRYLLLKVIYVLQLQQNLEYNIALFLYQRTKIYAYNYAYPEKLSSGLVLVKWWLLAIPHYIIVGIFAGGWGWGSTGEWEGGLGLILALVIIVAVVLLFTSKYPAEIFRLVIGLNRWVFRVGAYASLMTDEYPPFRLWDD